MCISCEIKRRLKALAKARFGKVVDTPVEPFQILGEKIIYWFNDEYGSTHIVSENINKEET